MRDFKNGKIYTIRCFTDLDLIYVGSTCQTLTRRWTDHRKDCKKRDTLLYKTIRENGGIDNFYIELVEYFPCETLSELNKREGEIMREKVNTTMNTLMAGTYAGKTQKEYDAERDKTDKRIEYKKFYNKKYQNEHQEEIQKYRKSWYTQNQEKQQEDAKRRYYEKKDEISNKKKAERVECKCGSNIRRSDLRKHEQSKKHLSFISNII